MLPFLHLCQAQNAGFRKNTPAGKEAPAGALTHDFVVLFVVLFQVFLVILYLFSVDFLELIQLIQCSRNSQS